MASEKDEVMTKKSRVTSLLMSIVLAVTATAAFAQLPDFTTIVERNAPTVVNITARKTSADASDPSQMNPEEIPEIFRRFFGPMPGMPGMPGGPRGPSPERVSGGSGFVISSDGYILTNHHVIDGADEVTVRLRDRRELSAKVVGSDPDTDIALLKVEATGLTAVTLGDSDKLKPGQWVLAIGSPFGLEETVTAGIVSSVARTLGNDQRYVPFIQTDVAINRGNSGGPLFNLAGEVVGINSQIFSTSGGSIGLSFSIPIDTAKNVMEQLRTKGRVSRGVIGVQIQNIDRDRAEALGLSKPAGALVAELQPGGAAEKAGVRVGDVITSFNGREVGDSSELPPMVGAIAPGARATLGVFRDGRSLSLPITVAELGGSTAGTPPAAQPDSNAGGTTALGLVVRNLTAQQREQLGVGEEGVLVERVTGQAAGRAGIQPGDVVLAVGRARIRDASGFERAAAEARPGQAIMLLVRRGEANVFVAIRPEATR
jgi:serine protease Do